MPALGSWRQEDQGFNLNFSYMGSSRPAWAVGDPVLKDKEREKERIKRSTDVLYDGVISQ